MDNIASTQPMIIATKNLAKVKVATMSNAGTMGRTMTMTMTRNTSVVVSHCITNFAFL